MKIYKVAKEVHRSINRSRKILEWMLSLDSCRMSKAEAIQIIEVFNRNCRQVGETMNSEPRIKASFLRMLLHDACDAVLFHTRDGFAAAYRADIGTSSSSSGQVAEYQRETYESDANGHPCTTP